jgi:hypothetical protein
VEYWDIGCWNVENGEWWGDGRVGVEWIFKSIIELAVSIYF